MIGHVTGFIFPSRRCDFVVRFYVFIFIAEFNYLQSFPSESLGAIDANDSSGIHTADPITVADVWRHFPAFGCIVV